MSRSFRNSLLVLLGIIAVYFFSVSVANPPFFPRKSRGSFEYVRKAEGLLRQRKFADAIANYEKAYAASPESDEIRNGLVNAYTDYAETFLESDKYDEAIALLLKARSTVQNSSTAQNLAVVYAKRALKELRGGAAAKAAEDLARSRETARPSNIARKSLAATMYTDAAGEYNAGRVETALVLLEEALRSDYDWRICDFLANIHYQKRDLAKARSYFEQALSLNPGADQVRKNIEKLEREMALAANETSTDLAHFVLRYDKDLPVDAALAGRVLESAYALVGKDLGYYLPEKTAVFFYSAKDFKEVFKLPGMVRAFYDGSIRMPYPREEMAERALTHYIFHEYVHAVVSAKTKNNCPPWLSEGIATWAEVRMEDPAGRVVLRAEAIGDRPLSIAELNSVFSGSVKDAPDLQTSYLRAYTFVRFVVDTWGDAGLRDILGRMAAGQHVVNAIDDRFLLSEKELERRWNAYTREKLVR